MPPQKPPQIIDLQLMITMFFSGILLSLRPDCWWDSPDNGGIAQLVEQRTENPCVAGSIPAPTTDKKRTISPLFLCPLLDVIFGGPDDSDAVGMSWMQTFRRLRSESSAFDPGSYHR